MVYMLSVKEKTKPSKACLFNCFQALNMTGTCVDCKKNKWSVRDRRKRKQLI